jgi:hypothetical protein
VIQGGSITLITLRRHANYADSNRVPVSRPPPSRVGSARNSTFNPKRNLPEKYPCQHAADRRDDSAQAKSNDWKQDHDTDYCKYDPRAYGNSRMRLFGSRALVDLSVAPPRSRPLPRWWDPDSHVGIEACRGRPPCIDSIILIRSWKRSTNPG